MAAARAELGVVETRGAGNTARVREYLAACKGPRRMLQLDSTPWCSAYACFCMEQVGIRSTDNLAARSWLKYGDEIPLRDARYGDVTIFSRGLFAPPKSVINAPGHVAFLDRIIGDQAYVLGGNQSDRVSVAAYPLRRLLAVRRPSADDLVLHELLRGRA
jgi:uncharacterized protein (TIGR02594 family)